MDVLKIAEFTSADLWSQMIRRQREQPEIINPNQKQWLADEIHTLLHDIRTNEFHAGDNMKAYEEVVRLAETNQLPEADQCKLDFSQDAVREYHNLLRLEKDLKDEGLRGTNLNPRKFRVSYDRVFLAHPPFEYKGSLITGASLNLTLKCMKDGREILFGENEGTSEERNFRCTVDKNHGFTIEYVPDKESSYDSIACEATDFFLDYYEGRLGDLHDDCPESMADMPCSASMSVTKEEFIQVIHDHWENFDNSDNRPAQSCAWCHTEVSAQTD